MWELWRSSSRVRFLVLAVFAPTIITAHDELYQIHQLVKNNDFIRHPKREASCQQSGYNLCPASVDGGCCPDGYACAVSSCYATTAGPTTACGSAGYYNCPITAGAGTCCPVGYICAKQSCEPPAGVTGYSATCPTSYFGCPSSLGYGCCPNGMQCGSKTCYNTTPQTFPVSSTVTTTNANGDAITTVVTTTEVITPGGPDASSATSSFGSLAAVPKLIPSVVSKMPAIETGSSDSGSDSNGGGLSGGQLGGIVGGAIALLIIIITIAAIVIWRLKRTEKAARAAAGSRRDQTSSGQPRSHKSGFGQPSVSEVDGTDVDSGTRAAYNRARSPSSTTAGGYSRSETPNYYGSNASTTPPAWAQTPPLDDGRQSSMDSYGARYTDAASTTRPSVESQASRAYSYGHARQYSNASELDGSGVSELETPDAAAAEAAARRRSSSITRKGRGGEGAAAAVPVGMPLGTLDEVMELHGHYGPTDLAVGQTAARLRAANSSMGSLPHPGTDGVPPS
ncbi:hypothetical protein F4821DRAFT_172549 [Hypoxylon rubiginosum]|uniref:Uncharacterized protein n=1 Tax=Hypoxylon rubiginosum TaxID=110542 RepID=A0ACC0DG23_9PEZI|nr:hypothetical protein F4821DRAFT_172549 [Hypoxylon rubiginosum]